MDGAGWALKLADDNANDRVTAGQSHLEFAATTIR
jgi:hypothetical protein